MRTDMVEAIEKLKHSGIDCERLYVDIDTEMDVSGRLNIFEPSDSIDIYSVTIKHYSDERAQAASQWLAHRLTLSGYDGDLGERFNKFHFSLHNIYYRTQCNREDVYAFN